MPYSLVLSERIRELLPERAYPAKRMFGGVAFFCRGHILVGVFGDGMLVRLAAADGDALLRQPGFRPLSSDPQWMKGFVVVDEALLDSDELIETWIERALQFNQSLPTK